MPTLHVTVFWCKDADPLLFRTKPIFDACRGIAEKHGFSIETLPHGVRDAPHVLDFFGDLLGPREFRLGEQERIDTANRRVRGLAYTAFPGNGRLPIIFGTLTNATSELWIGQTIMSLTVPGKTLKSDWMPWCIVDPIKASDRPDVVLHEMGHAAGALHNYSAKAGPGDLMIDGDRMGPTTIEPPVLDLFRNSYFCW